MDMKKIGQFLAQLRKDHGLTQEDLGSKLGVTNKTISRWENGNYLPPADMLKSLSEIYGLTINEILSGERLDETQYRQKAEDNITAVMQTGNFSRREKLLVVGEWLRKKWWFIFLCLAPSILLYSLLPHVVSEVVSAFAFATMVLTVGLVIVCNHIVNHVAEHSFSITKSPTEFRALKIMRTVWLGILGISLFISIELGLATLHAMTPAGTADGYAIGSMFYDILITDGGIYLDNCWIALHRSLWQFFSAVIINLDLTVLLMYSSHRQIS